LAELDEIYTKVVCGLSPAERKNYCKRLICRVRFELRHCKCGEEGKKLRQLLKAAEKEIAVIK
jgi:hypothetical protein